MEPSSAETSAGGRPTSETMISYDNDFRTAANPLIAGLADLGFGVVSVGYLSLRLENNQTELQVHQDQPGDVVTASLARAGDETSYDAEQIARYLGEKNPQRYGSDLEALRRASEALLGFFVGPARSFLDGDPELFEKLKNFNAQHDAQYFRKLLRDQRLGRAERLYGDGDYAGLIDLLGQAESDLTPKEMRLLRIAKKLGAPGHEAESES